MCEARMQVEAAPGQDRPVKVKKLRKGLEPLNADEDSAGNCKFARALGSVDWHTREQGLQALTIWLTRTNPSEADLTKIWKALFFCFWHSDKGHVQAELAERLAAILPLLSSEGALLYFKVFAKTMQREWFGIDRLRLDKFMMLARKFLHQLFVHLQEAGWDSERTAAYCAFLADEVLLRSDREPSAGFSLHLADVAITELCAACEEAGPVPREALEALLEPFCQAAARTKRPALLARLQDGVFGQLLQTGTTGALANMDMRALAAKLFDLGALPEVKARNREVLYALSKLFERAQAKRQKKSPESARDPAAPQDPEPSASQTAGNASASGDAGVQASAKQKSKKQKTVDLPAARDPAAAGEGQQAALATASRSAEVPSARAPVQEGVEMRGQPADVQSKPATSASPSSAAKRVQSPASAHPAELPAALNGHASMQSTGKKRKKSMAALVAEAAAMKAGRAAGGAQPADVAPVAAGQAGQATPTPASAPVKLTESQRKKVKFQMKNNLYFEKGGPVPPAEVRTPPTAKPKGSALKKTSSVLPRPKSPRSPKARGGAAAVLKRKAKAALFF